MTGATGGAVIPRRGLLAGLAGIGGVGALAGLSGCAGPGATSSLTMACGEAGGRYIQFGELLRGAMAHRGTDLELITTNGSADNVLLLGDGSVDLGIALADTAEAAGGSADADGPPLVAIGRVYQNYLQCLVPADGPVRALADLAGRRVSIGAPGSGAAVTTRRLLGAAGLDGADGVETREQLLVDALDALEHGTIDALFWSGGIPTPMVEELDARLPVALVDLGGAFPALEAAYPELYVSTRVPLGVYSSAAQTPTIGIPNLLLARPDLPDGVARTLVDALIDDAEALVPAGSVGVQFLTPANLIDTGALPLHPAARARYRERYG